MQNNHTVLLNALLMGATFTYDGREYGMSDDNRLLTKLVQTNLQTKEEQEIWCEVDCDISYFMKMANSLPDEVIVNLAFVLGTRKVKLRNFIKADPLLGEEI